MGPNVDMTSVKYRKTKICSSKYLTKKYVKDFQKNDNIIIPYTFWIRDDGGCTSITFLIGTRGGQLQIRKTASGKLK